MAEADDGPCPYFDVSTAAKTERLSAMSAGEGIQQGLPKDNMEATLKLAALRPARQSVDALFDLLKARADPNYDAGPNKMSPLRNVLCFAHNSSVSEMRELLLDYGAREKHDDRKRWRTRQSADMNETTWLMSFNNHSRKALDSLTVCYRICFRCV